MSPLNTILELAAFGAVVGLLRRLEKTAADVLRLRRLVVVLAYVQASIVIIFLGVLLWLTVR